MVVVCVCGGGGGSAVRCGIQLHPAHSPCARTTTTPPHYVLGVSVHRLLMPRCPPTCLPAHPPTAQLWRSAR